MTNNQAVEQADAAYAAALQALRAVQQRRDYSAAGQQAWEAALVAARVAKEHRYQAHHTVSVEAWS